MASSTDPAAPTEPVPSTVPGAAIAISTADGPARRKCSAAAVAVVSALVVVAAPAWAVAVAVVAAASAAAVAAVPAWAVAAVAADGDKENRT
jgi:hypothetical protein